MRYLVGTTLLAAGLIFASGAASFASDVIRLGGPSAEPGIIGGTDIELVRGGGGGGGGRGGGGGHVGGGGRGGVGGGARGGFAGARGGAYGRGGFAGGGYGRGGFGYGYGRGGYGYGRGYGYGGYGGYGGYYGGYGLGYYGGYYNPYFYGAYYNPYYYGANYIPYTSVAPTYYYPIAGTAASVPLYQASASYAPSPGVAPSFYTPGATFDGTYPYDGGPQNIIPIPRGDEPAPMNAPRGIVPLDGKLVSVPRETSGGFSPVTTPEIQRLRYVSFTNTSTRESAATSRYTYPAYGEQPLPPAPRKAVKR